jgi:hypothetical protein
MAATLKDLIIDTQLSTSAANIIVPGTAESLFIGRIVFTNTNATTNRTVTVWRLEDATATSATNYLVKKTIAPGKTWLCPELTSQTLTNLAKVWADQDAGTDVNVSASGVSEL